jgi:hypothetical protein
MKAQIGLLCIALLMFFDLAVDCVNFGGMVLDKWYGVGGQQQTFFHRMRKDKVHGLYPWTLTDINCGDRI